jgi:hypothetical protein
MTSGPNDLIFREGPNFGEPSWDKTVFDNGTVLGQEAERVDGTGVGVY